MEKMRKKNRVKNIVLLLACVLVVFLLHTFVFLLVSVSGKSMLPTLKDRQIILVEKVSFAVRKPARGDIVVFRDPRNKELVKRVMGLAGEKIEIKNGVVWINDTELSAEFQFPSNEGSNMDACIVSENCYFLMGDNRDYSLDSREFGEVNMAQIIGRMLFIFF